MLYKNKIEHTSFISWEKEKMKKTKQRQETTSPYVSELPDDLSKLCRRKRAKPTGRSHVEENEEDENMSMIKDVDEEPPTVIADNDGYQQDLGDLETKVLNKKNVQPSDLVKDQLNPADSETYKEYQERLKQEEEQRQKDFIAWAESIQPKHLLARKRKFQDKTVRSDKNTTFYLLFSTKHFHKLINVLMRYDNLIHIEAGSFREKTHVKVVFKERRTLNLDQLIERMHLDDLNARLEFLASIAYFHELDCIATTVFNFRFFLMWPDTLKEAIVGLTRKFVYGETAKEHTIGSLKFNTSQCFYLAKLGFHKYRDYITSPLTLADVFMRHVIMDEDWGSVSHILDARWLKHGNGPQLMIAGNVLLLVVFKYGKKTDFSFEQIDDEMYLEEACSYSLLEEYFARRNMVWAAELQIEVMKRQNCKTEVKFNFGRKIKREWVGVLGIDLKHTLYMKYMRTRFADLVQTKFVHHNRRDKLLPERLQDIDFRQKDEEYYKHKIEELNRTTPFIGNLVKQISTRPNTSDKIRFLLEYIHLFVGWPFPDYYDV